MNKKAQISDIVTILILFFGIMLTAPIALFVFNEWDAEVDASFVSDAQSGMDDMEDAWDTIDIGMVLLYGACIVALIVSAFFIKTNPAFFFIGLIFFIFVMLVSGALANAYSEVIDSSDALNESGTGLSKTTFMATKLPIFAMIMGVVFFAVMWAKLRSAG